MRPPSTAPGRLFKPPSTAAASPLNMASSMKNGSSSRTGARNTPATTASAEATPQAKASTPRVGMPSVWAACRFSDVARMARPSLVFWVMR